MQASHFIERWGHLWWGLALLGVLGQAVAIWVNAANGVPEQTDFLSLYASAKAWREGLSLLHPFVYVPFFGHISFVEGAKAGFSSDNLNFPLTSIFMAPLTLLELRPAYYLWCASQLGVALGVWLWLLHKLSLAQRGAAVALFAFYFPVFANALIGQNGVLLFVLLGLFVGSVERGWHKRAAIWLGLALLLKLFVGLLFVWLVLQRQWRMVILAGTVWAVGVAVSLFVLGVQPHLEWLQLLHTHEVPPLNWNAAWQAMVMRYSHDLVIGRWLVAGAWLLCLGCLCSLAWRKSDTLLGVAICLPMMLFLSPLGWLYYFPVLLLSGYCFATLGGYQQRGPAVVFSLGFVCTMVPQYLATNVEKLQDSLATRGILPDVKVENGQLVTYFTDERTWLVLPELYTLALVLLMVGMVWWAYYAGRARSTVNGI